MSDSFIFGVGLFTTVLCGAFLVITVREIRKTGRVPQDRQSPVRTVSGSR